MSDLVLDVGLAAKLKVAFARNGWSVAEIDSACEGDKLGQFRKVLLGQAAITPLTIGDHIIDCDADPFTPDGWSVEEHQKGGQFQWDPAKVSLWLAKGQQGNKYVEGNKLRKELDGKPVFNACALDYLLANPHLIPEEWKGKFVFFWGTIYRSRDGYLYVRYLYWYDGRWRWSSRWLDSDFDGSDPAAVRAS